MAGKTFSLINNSEDIKENFYLKKMSVQSEETFFNPGWFNPEEYTFYTIEGNEEYRLADTFFIKDDVMATFRISLDS